MGLKELFARLTRGSDERALERAEEESHMTAQERAIDSEDFEARKDDAYVSGEPYAGAEAASAADDDVDELGGTR